jgi:hypothetical protein
MNTFGVWKQRQSTHSPYRQAQINFRGLIRTSDPENRDVARINGDLNAMRQHSARVTASIHS